MNRLNPPIKKTGPEKSTGWILIHRKIKNHWLWKSERRLKWWIDVLLTVNHTDTKVLIKNKLIECKRGQSVRSLETWAKDWNVSKCAVRNFFKLLQNDSMLIMESVQFTTRITVCNYDNYQDVVNARKTLEKRCENGDVTQTNNDLKNELNNEETMNNPPVKKPVLEKPDFIDSIIQEFLTVYPDYQITTLGKERCSAGRLAKLWKGLYPDLNTEQTLDSMREFFIRCNSISNDWYQSNMSLTTIHTKYSVIMRMLSKGGRQPILDKINHDVKLNDY